jgi:tRNA threonylcarbamoyladenosine biosynthesis protein TsaB
MNTICFDTSGPRGCVTLVQNEKIVASMELSRVYGHNETLLPAISILLDQAGISPGELKRVLFVRGPGSFTGLRIGIAVAYGFLAANPELDLVGYTSLYLLNRAAIKTGQNRVLSIIDARKKQVYAAFFENDAPVSPYAVMKPEMLPDFLQNNGISQDPFSMIGSALEPYGELLTQFFPQCAQLPPPSCLSTLLAETLSDSSPGESPSIEPVYIRKSDAELNRNKTS